MTMTSASAAAALGNSPALKSQTMVLASRATRSQGR